MNPYITLDRQNEVERTTRITPRKRSPLPPQDTRDWMTPRETALALGCSVATVHRLRRGIIPGVEPLPCSQYGRKKNWHESVLSKWQAKVGMASDLEREEPIPPLVDQI